MALVAGCPRPQRAQLLQITRASARKATAAPHSIRRHDPPSLLLAPTRSGGSIRVGDYLSCSLTPRRCKVGAASASAIAPCSASASCNGHAQRRKTSARRSSARRCLPPPPLHYHQHRLSHQRRRMPLSSQRPQDASVTLATLRALPTTSTRSTGPGHPCKSVQSRCCCEIGEAPSSVATKHST